MLKRISGIRIAWIVIFALILLFAESNGQDYDTPETPKAPAKEIEACNGIFISYNFQGREKEYPLVKNVTAQAWSFKSMLTVLNTGLEELKAWQVFVGFQYQEVLVSVEGAVVMDGDGLPIKIGKNGTTLSGFPQTDLETAIDTAGDMTQMQVQVNIKGTQFGLGAKVTPMPRTIKLANEGFKCPAATHKAGYMHVCCKKDPKFKKKVIKTKFLPRRYGDLDFTYDVLKAYENKYLAQVTIDNNHPLGRLDQWNLTWEWMRNEFINTMRGAYTHRKDPSECIYGPQGQYYQDFDFSTVMNCQKKPIIGDLPPESENDDNVGRLPYCCKNGTLLPKTMNETKARAIFQMEVFKLPPDMNRTALTPPQNWHIEGRISPDYKCGPPIRVDPSPFPDPSGIAATTFAIASWQVSCNMTRPKPKQAKCCVSYSAYYADGAVPCGTCACGCDDDVDSRCDQNAAAMHLPPDALLVPFPNRTEKALAFARIKHRAIPRRLPCPDNCGVSINWHVDADYKSGWTARLTLFNWDDGAFADWYAAVQMRKAAAGFEKVYSFNGTKLTGKLNNTVFMQGLPGLNYLVGEVNGSNPARDPRVPGKQQSVLSFKKKGIAGMDVVGGDGFPSRVFFNGEECALPKELPKKSGAGRVSAAAAAIAVVAVVLVMVTLQ